MMGWEAGNKWGVRVGKLGQKLKTELPELSFGQCNVGGGAGSSVVES